MPCPCSQKTTDKFARRGLKVKRNSLPTAAEIFAFFQQNGQFLLLAQSTTPFRELIYQN